MQKKDIYNLNLKVTITFTITLIFLLFSWSCGKKAEPIRPNSESSSKEKIVNE